MQSVLVGLEHLRTVAGSPRYNGAVARSGAEQHRALVIGVDHYIHVSERQQLRGCVNDALAVHALLVERLAVPRSRIDLLLSARPGRAVPVHRAATTAELRAAFARLADDAAPGDEVFVFLAGHGVRVSCAATGEYLYGFAPSDAVDHSGALANLISGRELNRLVRTLIARGASPTVIADTCHSGGSMRIPGAGVARRLVPESGESEWLLSEAAWRSFLATHPAPEPEVRSGDVRTGSGWLRDVEGMRDWVMLAACRDSELATERPWHDLADGGRRGVLTGSLLGELARVPDAVLPVLRWVELMPGVREAIGGHSAQRPTLEGSATRPVFGHGWQPAHRGFVVVCTEDPARIELAGGELHGLEPGAEVSIGDVVARVEQATPSSCMARLPPGAVVPAGATAALIAPGPRAVRTRACVLGPAADAELSRPEPLLVLVPHGPADIEALSWPGRGWIVRPYDPRGGEPTADDAIAYLGEPDDRLLAARLGAAFAHWARYRAIRDRASSDPMLFGLIEVALRIGPTAEASARREPDPAGLHRVLEDEPLWIAMQVRRTPPGRLFLGVILCSDDGNVIPLWPPPGGDPTAGQRGPDETALPEGQTIHVGADRYTPAFPTIRRGPRGQQASRYTFQVIACTLRDDDPPPDLSALAIAKTVQDSVDAVTAGRPKSIEPYVPEVPQRWCTWDVPVVVRRA